MTRKDYVIIAETIENVLFTYNMDEVVEEAFSSLADALSDKFAEDNQRFDRDKFVKACGL